MAKIIRGSHDSNVESLAKALEEYETRFPGSEASVYRQNPGAVRVRVIDDRFAGMPRSRRHDDVWKFLGEHVNEDTLSEVSTLLLLPTSELRSSMANLEFEDPMPVHL